MKYLVTNNLTLQATINRLRQVEVDPAVEPLGL
jgi:hypothetical protein